MDAVEIERAAKRIERQNRDAQRAFKREEEARAAEWLTHVESHATRRGLLCPQPIDLSMLRKLAEIDGPFTAARVGRQGWCGIRSTAAATAVLERFVRSGWLFRVPPNRQGQVRYAFTGECALGRLPHEERPGGVNSSLGLWQWCNAQEKAGFPELVAADMAAWGERGTGGVGGGLKLDCGVCEVPDQTAEGDLWGVARTLAFEEGTLLHRIAESIDDLSPIQKAYAMAIAKDRLTGGDSIKTPVRGIADYLGMDYNALLHAIAAAVWAMTKLNDGSSC